MNLIEWEDRNQIKDLYTYNYWNDIEEEKKKDWWVQSKEDIKKLNDYIVKSGLKEEFDISVEKLNDFNLLKGKVLDVAAGVCWTSALLSKFKEIECIDALEFSYHRINDIAPKVIEGLQGDERKIRRIFGSFYNIKESNKYDLIFMSQAFHHAEKPLRLLIEIDRVLKRGGGIILIGEHLISSIKYVKKLIKYSIKNMKIETNFYKFYRPDNILGDHYYRISDYYFIFQSYGYSVQHFTSTIRNSMIVIAIKN